MDQVTITFKLNNRAVAEGALVGRGLNAASIADAANAAMSDAKPFSDALASE